MDTPSVADLHQVVEELTHRVERLEAELAAVRAVGPAGPAAAGAGDTGELPPDVVLAISAAIAAYLGKR